MKFRFRLAVLMALASALVVVSCTADEPAATPSRAATNTATASPPPVFDASPTRASGSPEAPSAARSALWLVDVERGTTTSLYEGDGQVSGRFDPDGQSVSALVHLLRDAGWRSQRFDLDGQGLEEFDDRLLIFVSPDGRSRYYTSVAPDDLPNGRFVLDHDDAPVVLDAPPGTFAAGFSPSGDRLLAGSGSLENPSTVVFSYRIYDVETGGILGTIETRAREGTDGGESPRWSPSGRFIAASGNDGLYVHDTETGEATFVGAGFSRWSPREDAILALDEDGNLDIVRFPGGERTRLASAIGRPAPLFGGEGAYAYWAVDGLTTVVDATTGARVADWSGQAYAYPGVDPLVAADTPVAALISRTASCRGIELHHSARPDDTTCLAGAAAPRWSPDGRLLAYAVDDEVRVLDRSTGAERVVADGIPPDSVIDGALIRWSPDGGVLLIQWPSGGLGWSEE